jgi:rhamnogalacturonyl hydrolase YesR/catechol 2,3-dioxygenase-like lactoylglutathione lyase family enzyme
MKLTSVFAALFCATLGWAQAPNQVGIAHVAFRVANLEASRAFYVDKMGFQEFFALKDSAGKITEDYLKVNDHQIIELYPQMRPEQPLGLMHVCWEASDIQAMREEYAKRGLDIREPRKASAGNMITVAREPEGQTIEYTQYMPGSRHYEARGKFLGANRVATMIVGAISPAKDPNATRAFYIDKLAFTAISTSIPARVRMPGNSGQELEIVTAGPDVKSGIIFGVTDLRATRDTLTKLGLLAQPTPEATAPDVRPPAGTPAPGARRPAAGAPAPGRMPPFERMVTKLTVADPDGAVITFVKAALPDAASGDYFVNWPAGMSPAEIGKRVAAHFIASPHQDMRRIIYPEVCTWYGSLTFAQLTKDKELTDSLVKRFDPLFGPEAAMIDRSPHVDQSVFGALPLQIYMETKDPRFLELGKGFADRQWENPLPSGLTKETRFWIDDMYMETIVQTQAFRATGNPVYLDRAALEMVAYLDKLQQPNGLFYHELEVKFFWGRGNGWMAAGMAELLSSLPKEHPHYARILAGYQKMMKGLLDNQGSDGMWRQLIDRPDAWPETSSTGMFTFAFVTGVKKGLLDGPTYGPAARKAWLALVGYIDRNADVTSVCAGTNKLDDLDYYMTRNRMTGDFHGQAPVVWAASALLR